MEIEKNKTYRDKNGFLWRIIAADEGYFIGVFETEKSAKQIFNKNGFCENATILLMKETTEGQRWINVYGWKNGKEADNGGSAPTTVHWWKEDAESSARMKLRENPNLILLATKRIFWKEGDVI